MDATEVQITLSAKGALPERIVLPLRIANGLNIPRQFHMVGRTPTIPVAVRDWLLTQPRYARAILDPGTTEDVPADETIFDQMNADDTLFNGNAPNETPNETPKVDDAPNETPVDNAPVDDGAPPSLFVDEAPDETWSKNHNTMTLRAYARRHGMDSVAIDADRETVLQILRGQRGSFEEV